MTDFPTKGNPFQPRSQGLFPSHGKGPEIEVDPFPQELPYICHYRDYPHSLPRGIESECYPLQVEHNTGAHSFKLNGKFHLHVLFLSMGHSLRQCQGEGRVFSFFPLQYFLPSHHHLKAMSGIKNRIPSLKVIPQLRQAEEPIA